MRATLTVAEAAAAAAAGFVVGATRRPRYVVTCRTRAQQAQQIADTLRLRARDAARP